MSNIIEKTGKYSLVIQLLTGLLMAIAYYYIYNINNVSEDNILKELLISEIIVQVVEGIFYTWMIYNISNFKNITIFRYYDWIITTPTMLISLIFYLIYLKDVEDKANNKKSIIEEYKSEIEYKEKLNHNTYFGMLQENMYNVTIVVILNFLMLAFGCVGELKLLSPIVSTFFGFIPFLMMFYLIYYNYAIHTNDGKTIFWYFSLVWGLYGFAALMNYNMKNVMYNILDLLAKNFFGLFLFYIIIKKTFYLNQI